MSIRIVASSVLVCAGLAIASCAPRTAATTWPWSDWYREGGGGEMGPFEQQRRACLTQVGISEPGAVAPDSSAENAYIICMNAAGWCTENFNCEKPGAS
jgi:hypothetical protein